MRQEADLERVRRDRGEGEPVSLERREQPRGGVEISLDHGDTEDSDDMAESQEEDEGKYLLSICHVQSH